MNSSDRHSTVRVVLLLLLPMLFACSTSTQDQVMAAEPALESTTDSIDELLSDANRRSGAAAAKLSLQAIEEMVAEEFFDRARVEIERLRRPDNLPPELRLQYAMLQARLAIQVGNTEAALRWLEGALASDVNPRTRIGQDYFLLLAQINSTNGRHEDAISSYLAVADYLRSSERSELVYNGIWQALTELADAELEVLAERADSYALRGWVELARVYRADQFSMRSQLDAIAQWRNTWTRHPAVDRMPAALLELRDVWEQRPNHIALILPLQEAFGNAIHEGFLSAYYQGLSVSREVPKISVYDSSNVSQIFSLYNQAVASGVDMIVGPVNKELVNQLHQLPALPVPTLALNYADDSSRHPDNLFQFGLAPEDEIAQAAALAWDAGYRNAALLTPQSQDYARLQDAFSGAWNELGGQLVSINSFSGDSDYGDVIKRLMAIDSSEARADRLLDILPRSDMEFTPRRRNDIDFIFLIANPRQGRQIKPTLAFYFAEGVPVYAMPSIYDGLNNQSENRDLDGIIFTDAPWVLDSASPLKQAVAENLRQAQGPLQRLRALGIDSYLLHARLQQLADRQIVHLQGVTGDLSMVDNQRIRRNLQVARFQDGLVTTVTGEDSASDD